MSANVDRLLRVNALLRRELADYVERDSVAPSGTLVSVTEVTTSVDLRHAAVGISVFGGGAKELAEVEKKLRHLRLEWQRRLGRNLSFKHTPVLEFHYDERMAAGDRVLEIIAKVEREEHDR